jgi:hypothetical protein
MIHGPWQTSVSFMQLMIISGVFWGTVMRRGYEWLLIPGFVLDDWIYWRCYYKDNKLQTLITAHNRWLPQARSVSSRSMSVLILAADQLHIH